MTEKKAKEKNEKIEVKDKEVKEGMFFAAVGYLFILCLVPLLLKKDNKFAIHHGRQALVLFICEIAALIVFAIPIVGWIISPILLVLFSILSLLGIIQVLMGKYWKMPMVHSIANKMTIP